MLPFPSIHTTTYYSKSIYFTTINDVIDVYLYFILILAMSVPSQRKAAESSSFLRQTLQNFFLNVLQSDQQCAEGF